MDLRKLFEMQKVLDERIVREKGLEGRDLLPEKILALQVELGECANEWRGFKFWSENQKPRTQVLVECEICDGTGDLNYEMVQEDAEGNGDHEYIDCEECSATGRSDFKNPLLEEYVDCLHFILSIGLEYKVDINLIEFQLKDLSKWETINKQFNYIFHLAGYFPYISQEEVIDKYYVNLFVDFIGLGEMLGFTWEEIQSAYMEKNATNHSRQENGY